MGVKLRELEIRNCWEILAEARLRSKQKTKKEDGILAVAIDESKSKFVQKGEFCQFQE